MAWAGGRAADPARGDVLLRLARGALSFELAGTGTVHGSPGDEAWLQGPGATFVTLRAGSELRGCIGTLEANRPLAEDVRANAIAAATRDPRFAPVTAAELPGLTIEVSLLGPTSPLGVTSQAEALEALQPGLDGVILRYGSQRATFLPQVWSQLPSPGDFLLQLKRKAGLADDFWHGDIEMWRYRVEKWSEAEQAGSGR